MFVPTNVIEIDGGNGKSVCDDCDVIKHVTSFRTTFENRRNVERRQNDDSIYNCDDRVDEKEGRRRCRWKPTQTQRRL